MSDVTAQTLCMFMEGTIQVGGVCLNTRAGERLARLGLLNERDEISSSDPALFR